MIVPLPHEHGHDLAVRLIDASARAESLAAVLARRMLGDPVWTDPAAQAGIVRLADRLAVDLAELRRVAA